MGRPGFHVWLKHRLLTKLSKPLSHPRLTSPCRFGTVHICEADRHEPDGGNKSDKRSVSMRSSLSEYHALFDYHVPCNLGIRTNAGVLLSGSIFSGSCLHPHRARTSPCCGGRREDHKSIYPQPAVFPNDHHVHLFYWWKLANKVVDKSWRHIQSNGQQLRSPASFDDQPAATPASCQASNR